jgi:hypothetical protein
MFIDAIAVVVLIQSLGLLIGTALLLHAYWLAFAMFLVKVNAADACLLHSYVTNYV